MSRDAEKEAEATMFAFELLMPEDDVRKQIAGKDALSMRNIEELAKRYGVESTVMAMRLGQLHLEAVKR